MKRKKGVKSSMRADDIQLTKNITLYVYHMVHVNAF